MTEVVWVGLGGCLGSVARYLVGRIPFEGDFPLMTFIVNFVGAVAIGAIAEIVGTTSLLSTEAALLLKTGVCGGFTTFSTFSLEVFSLMQNGKACMALLYAGSSFVACVLGVAVGQFLARGALSFLQLAGTQSA